MNKYLIPTALLVSLGANTYFVAGGAEQYASAVVQENRSYQFSGRAGEALETSIESGIALQALNHANNQLGTSLSFQPAACPIKFINIRCSVETSDSSTDDVWDWRYSTKDLVRQSTFSE